MPDLTAFCPECNSMVVLVVWDTCCGTSYNCSECGRSIEFVERREEVEG